MRWRMRRPGRSLSAGLLLAATLALSGLALLVVGGAAAVTYVNSSFLGRNGLEETAAHVRRALRFDQTAGPGDEAGDVVDALQAGEIGEYERPFTAGPGGVGLHDGEVCAHVRG